MSEGRSMNVDGLDGHREMFGYTIENRKHEGKDIGRLIHLYLEDDESWYEQTSFDEFWLEDLIATLTNLKLKLGHKRMSRVFIDTTAEKEEELEKVKAKVVRQKKVIKELEESLSYFKDKYYYGSRD